MSVFDKLQASYDAMVPDIDDEHNTEVIFEERKQNILKLLLDAASNEEAGVDIINIFADYISYIANGKASDEQVDYVYMFIHQMIRKPRWLNLNTGERIVEQAFNHAAEKAAKEELSF